MNNQFQKNNEARARKILVFILAGLYFIAYITRKNYSASLAAIIESEGIDKATAALPTTVLSITYAAFQFISGILGDKIKPRYLLSAGVLVTALANICISLKPNFVLITILWGINGMGQAFLWPSCVKLLTNHLDDSAYSKAAVSISEASNYGSIATYLLVPASLKIFPWNKTFLFAGVIALAFFVILQIALNYVEKNLPINRPYSNIECQNEQKETKKQSGPIIKAGILIPLIIFTIILQGMIRDGVSEWIPSFLVDVFKMDTLVSILIGVGIPIFAILCYRLANLIYRRFHENEFLTVLIFGIVATLSSVALFVFRNFSPILSIILILVLSACPHGMNLMLVSYAPARMKINGNVSTIAGIFNSGTYIGSTLSVYGMARLTDYFGWNATILSWIIIAVLTIVISLVALPKWTKFKKAVHEYEQTHELATE